MPWTVARPGARAPELIASSIDSSRSAPARWPGTPPEHIGTVLSRRALQTMGTQIQQRQPRLRARQVAMLQEVSRSYANLEVIGGEVSLVELQSAADRAAPHPVASKLQQRIIIFQGPLVEHNRGRFDRLFYGRHHGFIGIRQPRFSCDPAVFRCLISTSCPSASRKLISRSTEKPSRR
jgi:hypothetical protein